MRRRLYFLLPDPDRCRRLVSELRDAGLSRRYIHVIAAEGVPLEGLPDASELRRQGLSRALEIGASVGGVAGLCAGLLAVTLPPAGVVLAGGAALMISTAVGAGFGSIVSALITRDIPRRQIEAYRTAIASGQVLLILDVPVNTIPTAIRMVERVHPEVDLRLTAAEVDDRN